MCRASGSVVLSVPAIYASFLLAECSQGCGKLASDLEVGRAGGPALWEALHGSSCLDPSCVTFGPA